MEKFWKWLLKTDARGLFILSLVLLAAVTAWRAYDIVKAEKQNSAKAIETESVPPPELPEFKPLGVIGFVSNQFAPETLVVPINPFHPTFEAIVKTLVANSKSGTIELVVNGTPVEVHFEGNKLVDKDGNVVAEPFQKDMTKPGEEKKEKGFVINLNDANVVSENGEITISPATGERIKKPPRKPRVSFKGMMQRPDGKFAAYLSDSIAGARFVTVGDRVRNSTVVASGRDGVELKLDDGSTVKLTLGGKPVVLQNTEDGK